MKTKCKENRLSRSEDLAVVKGELYIPGSSVVRCVLYQKLIVLY